MGCGHAGTKALVSLRMEKGYRDYYGHDIDTGHCVRGRFGFAVYARLKPESGLSKRDAVAAQVMAGPAAQAACAGRRRGSLSHVLRTPR